MRPPPARLMKEESGMAKEEPSTSHDPLTHFRPLYDCRGDGATGSEERGGEGEGEEEEERLRDSHSRG